MFLNVTSVDDVLVFGVPRELLPYNTQQTTAKLTQNTSCGMFFFCFSSCLPLFSFFIFWELNERVWREAITSLAKKSQPFVWQELQRELKRVRIPPLWKNGSNLDRCKWYICFFSFGARSSWWLDIGQASFFCHCAYLCILAETIINPGQWRFYYIATIYNSSFHCNRIQICESRLNFYCLYCLQDLQTLSTEYMFFLGLCYWVQSRKSPSFRNNKELNELLSCLQWKYFFPLWGNRVDRNMKGLCIKVTNKETGFFFMLLNGGTRRNNPFEEPKWIHQN